MSRQPPSNERLLVVAAHPDDEVLGCGATVALRVAQKWEARLVIVTGGITGRSRTGQKSDASNKEAQSLREESERAAQVLGFSAATRLDFPDNRLDTVSRMDLAHELLAVLKDYRPTAVFTHHPGDYNWDHGVVFDAVMMAARHSPGEFGPAEILAFEVPSSTERGRQSADRAFLPNVYVDVERTIDKKKLAMKYYETEYRAYPHPRSIEGIEYTARKRGLEVGIQYAEAFELIRKVEK